MRKWYKVALFNLVVLALLGFVLRYKINFPLEFVEQKKLLHAHSHFAFSGWISFLLQVLILQFFTNNYSDARKFWDRFFVISTIVNYGMIVAFALWGYAFISIALSTASLILSYIFCYRVYGAVRSGSLLVSNQMIMAALFFLVLSSLGPYALSIITVTKATNPYYYHNSLYFFLHFQYNGWFTFAVLGFLFQKLETSSMYNKKAANIFMWLLIATCIPAYFLTTLWRAMPTPVIINNILTAAIQLVALYYLLLLLYKNRQFVFEALPGLVKWMYSIAIAAFIVKTLLQCFSAHPQLAQLAFAYRPIIIGYLHLIFLVFVSIYLLGILAEKGMLPLSQTVTRAGLIIFSAGVIINEILLGIQGVISILYIYLPSISLLLFVNTIIILVGSVLLYIAVLPRSKDRSIHYFIKK